MSKEDIYKILDKSKPDIIAVELCEVRVGLKKLTLEEDSLLMKIATATQSKAKKENIAYGSDMANAILYANENKIQVGLIDRDLIETSNLLQKIPEKELKLFTKEINELENKNLKEKADNFNPENEIKKTKEDYPIAFEFLVTSRDLIIANKLLRLEKNNPIKNIIVLIGKGHLKQVGELIK